MFPFRTSFDEEYFDFDVSISELSIWDVSIEKCLHEINYDVCIRSVGWKFSNSAQVFPWLEMFP